MNDDLVRLEQSQKAKAMNLSEWRKSRVHEHDLPSGLHVKLRDVDMTDMLATGKLPPMIIDAAEKAVADGQTDLDLKKMATEAFKNNGTEILEMIDAFVELTLVEPQVGAVADDTHITLSELPLSDKMEIMGLVGDGDDRVKNFREEQGKLLATLQHGDSLPPETERVLPSGE